MVSENKTHLHWEMEDHPWTKTAPVFFTPNRVWP